MAAVIAGLRAITLDLDDTLWPIEPAIARAEIALHDWLARHAPAVVQRYDRIALRALRDRVAEQRPDWAHDFTRIRHHSIGLALADCGHDPALADAAFEAFFAARNELLLYEEVEAALTALATHYPLMALTNGNADLRLAGVAQHFVGSVSAREFGVGKPDPRIFHEACRRLGVAPHEVLHVGDDWMLDVEGARAAGLHAAWLCRTPAAAVRDAEVWTIAHLGELVDRLVPSVTN
ncbi:HAD family hydrolase [Ideonella sp. BN130291]|uniref:HAD family hydrolase n=1 Tax=Ideonella sp. BN130291 TaxID=3112940 RepID=UPI002E26D2FC|nr:HAD-IA family hydrolase [Ideonella sp. BN130291]